MNKKAYMSPTTDVVKIKAQKLLGNNSITTVGGKAGIQKGGDESSIVEGADSRRGGGWFDDEDE